MQQTRMAKTFQKLREALQGGPWRGHRGARPELPEKGNICCVINAFHIWTMCHLPSLRWGVGNRRWQIGAPGSNKGYNQVLINSLDWIDQLEWWIRFRYFMEDGTTWVQWESRNLLMSLRSRIRKPAPWQPRVAVTLSVVDCLDSTYLYLDFHLFLD